MIEQRAMPFSLDAESAVLGAVMSFDHVLIDIAGLVTADEFFRDAHRIIFRTAQRLADTQKPVDFLSVKEELARTRELEAVGGPAYLASLSSGIPRSSNVAHYAGIVREHATRRALIIGANAILAEAYEGENSAAVLEHAERAMLNITSRTMPKGFVHIRDILPRVMEEIQARASSPTGVSGVPSGLRKLDALTNGFQPGNLIIVAARPAMGKSALVMNIAEHAAAHGHVAGVFSLEMADTEIAARTLTGASHIDSYRLQRGQVRESEWTQLADAIGRVSDWPIYIDDSPFMTSTEMRSKARRLKAQHGLGLLVVDYTQLMISADSDRRENRTIELAGITRALKGLAKELQVPVLALSQLSRKLEDRSEKTPQLSDLRESGSLEQDADLVLFIHREFVYTKSPDTERIAEIIIGKQRNGPSGAVKVAWIPEETRFADLEPW